MKILVLVDFSEKTLNAARYVAALSWQLPVEKLILYHSYQIMPFASDAPLYTLTEIDTIKKDSLNKITRIKEELQQIINPATSIEGYTDQRSLEFALRSIVDSERIDMVVIGVKHKSLLDKFLFENTTGILIKECAVPLLLIPEIYKFKTISKIGFACDLEDLNNSSTSLEFIKKYANFLNAQLYVVHVAKEGKAQSSDEIIRKMSKLYNLQNEAKPIYHFINDEDVADGIFKFIREHQIDLLMAIPKKHSFIERLFNRSVTKELLSDTSIPLLILKEPELTITS
ncbi:MAG: universal stress protein [Daejeonella sp.]